MATIFNALKIILKFQVKDSISAIQMEKLMELSYRSETFNFIN